MKDMYVEPKGYFTEEMKRILEEGKKKQETAQEENKDIPKEEKTNKKNIEKA